jgi:glycosyltransferase involved in cell wall biosynthesis
MKKRLLFIIDSLGSGGAEKSLISLLPLIDYTRYDVDLIIFARGGVYEKYVPKEVNILDYKLYESTIWGKIKKRICHAMLSSQHRLNKKRHGAEVHWRTMHHLYKVYPKEYDVAIAYQQGVPTFFLATKVKAKKKIAWVNVNIFAAGYNTSYCEKFYVKIDNIVAVSQELYLLLYNKIPSIRDRVVCIYDIVNQDVIRRMSLSQVSDMGDSDDSSVNIVTVGRLVPQKNYLLAVDSANILKKRGLSFKWYFVGDGGQKRLLAEKIDSLGLQDYVILLGFKENPYPYMAKADVYVQTSSFEGFGLTIAEAKILHRPIVSTNFDVVKDQITDGQNGLIADMTPESVAEKIQELLDNESRRNKIIKNLERENNTTSTTEIQKFNKLIEA